MDYYAILGVHPTAEDVVIRAAYKALAQRYHPDRHTGAQDEAHRKMSELTKAYDVLADPVRRTKYDRRRLTYAQSVTTYFNSSPRDMPVALDPRNRRAAATRRRSRIALSALMTAVVVLSAFNLYQYSGQLRDWLGPVLSAPITTEAPSRTPVAASGAGHAAVAAPGAAAGGRNLPIGQAGPAGAAPAVNDAAPAPRPEAAFVAETPGAKAAPEAPPRQVTVEASATSLVPAVSTAIEAPAPKQDAPEKRAAARPAAAAIAPASAPVTATESDRCTDTVAALGLCSPHTTARNK